MQRLVREMSDMGMTREQLEIEVLGSPVGERAHLARRLLESLDGDTDDDPAVV